MVVGSGAGPGGEQLQLARGAGVVFQQGALAPRRGLLGGGANHSDSQQRGLVRGQRRPRPPGS